MSTMSTNRLIYYTFYLYIVLKLRYIDTIYALLMCLFIHTVTLLSLSGHSHHSQTRGADRSVPTRKGRAEEAAREPPLPQAQHPGPGTGGHDPGDTLLDSRVVHQTWTWDSRLKAGDGPLQLASCSINCWTDWLNLFIFWQGVWKFRCDPVLLLFCQGGCVVQALFCQGCCVVQALYFIVFFIYQIMNKD